MLECLKLKLGHTITLKPEKRNEKILFFRRAFSSDCVAVSPIPPSRAMRKVLRTWKLLVSTFHVRLTLALLQRVGFTNAASGRVSLEGADGDSPGRRRMHHRALIYAPGPVAKAVGSLVAGPVGSGTVRMSVKDQPR